MSLTESTPVAVPVVQPGAIDWPGLVSLAARQASILDFDALAQDVIREVTAHTHAPRAILLFNESETEQGKRILRPVAASGQTAAAIQPIRETLAFETGSTDPAIESWRERHAHDSAVKPALTALTEAFTLSGWFSVPLFARDGLVGAIVVESVGMAEPVALQWLEAYALTAGVSLRNARSHSQAVTNLNARMNELAILQRIDLELSERMQPAHVYDMTLDWALRYTVSQAGSIAAFSAETDALRFVADIGYEATEENKKLLRSSSDGGIARRVVQSSHSELIPDVSVDPDFIPVSSAIRSHLSVPVIKDDRVIAVISVESRKLNHYTEDHLRFLERLAARAANAMDNARLFDQTLAEREKLSNIIANIADVVLVFNEDNRLILMNQSAIPALRLYADGHYEGVSADKLLEDTDLLPIYQRFRRMNQPVMQEVVLPNSRAFNAHLSYFENVGAIVVLQDITALKETDQLKNELIATVSHDLKQPLTVMQGYLELLQMIQPLEGKPLDYVRSAQRSINNMRNLIDDLLSLAKIESGIQLNVSSLMVKPLLQRCIEDIRGAAEAKAITIQLQVAQEDLAVMGDLLSLSQVFNNLISNGVKYTPPEGKLTVRAEKKGEAVMVSVEDTGMGISPEDQARVFERFFRVRRPETENIEGSGLGLAIVKRLVDLHRGQIGIESRLGEGTKFIVGLQAGSPADAEPL